MRKKAKNRREPHTRCSILGKLVGEIEQIGVEEDVRRKKKNG
jgi:hypothetical protein